MWLAGLLLGVLLSNAVQSAPNAFFSTSSTRVEGALVFDTGDTSPLTLSRPSKVTDVTVVRKADSSRTLVVSFTAASSATSHKVVLAEASITRTVEIYTTTEELTCTSPPCSVVDVYGLNSAYGAGPSLNETDKTDFEDVYGFGTVPGPHSLEFDRYGRTVSLFVSNLYASNQDTLEYAGKIVASSDSAVLVESTYAQSLMVSFAYADVVRTAVTANAAAVDARTFRARFHGMVRSMWTGDTAESQNVSLNLWRVKPSIEWYTYDVTSSRVRLSYKDNSTASFRDDVAYVKEVGSAYGDAIPVLPQRDSSIFIFDLEVALGACKTLIVRIDTVGGLFSAEAEPIEVCSLPRPELTGRWVHPDESSSNYTSQGMLVQWTSIDLADEYVVKVIKRGYNHRYLHTRNTSMTFFLSTASAVSVTASRNGLGGPASELFFMDNTGAQTAPVQKVQLLSPLPVNVQVDTREPPKMTFRVTWEPSFDYTQHQPVTGVSLLANGTSIAENKSVPLGATSVDFSFIVFAFPGPDVWEVSAQTFYFDPASNNSVTEETTTVLLTAPKPGQVDVDVEYMNRSAAGIVVHYDQSLGDGFLSHMADFKMIEVRLGDVQSGNLLLTKQHDLGDQPTTAAKFSMPFSLQEIHEAGVNTASPGVYQVAVVVQNPGGERAAVSQEFEALRPPNTGPLVRGRLVYGGRGLFLDVTGAAFFLFSHTLPVYTCMTGSDANVALTEVSIEIDSRLNDSAAVTQGNSAQFFVPLAADECVQGVNVTQTNVPDGSHSNLVQLVLRLTGFGLPADGSLEWFDLRDALRDEIADFVQAGTDTQVRVVALRAYTDVSSLQLLQVSGGLEVTTQIEGPDAPAGVDAFVNTCVSGTRAAGRKTLLEHLECSADDSSLPLDFAPSRRRETPRASLKNSNDDSNWWVFLVVAGALIGFACLMYACRLYRGGFSFSSDSEKAHRHPENAAMTELTVKNTEV
ncbi:MAG: hypothetical protein MHM6MM_002730 [Cercozoa sp. M6MM]